MLVKRLLCIVLITSCLSTIQAMNQNPNFVAQAFENEAIRGQIRAWLLEWLSENHQNVLEQNRGQLLGMAHDFVETNRENLMGMGNEMVVTNTAMLKEKAKELLQELMDKNKGVAFAWFMEQREKYSDGLAGKFLGIIDQALGRKSFPLTDAQLGAEFGLKEWSSACYRGDEHIIQILLNNPEYAHLLNLPDGQNQALSWAAFGYLNGEDHEGVVPTIGGFTLLVQDPGKRIVSNFQIEAGQGRIPFDEWLLHEASFPADVAKQSRLEELKKLLQPSLSEDRLDEIKDIRDRKESQRKAQAKAALLKKEKSFNKLSFMAGACLAGAALYYFMYKKGAQAPDLVAQAVKLANQG